MADDIASRENTRAAERAEAKRVRRVQLVLAGGFAVVAIARLMVEYIQSQRDGTAYEFYLIGIVVLVPLVPFIAWLVRPWLVANKLSTRPDLAARMSRTHDPYLRSQLLWIEYAMALSQVRTKQDATIPADYIYDAPRATQGMAFASTAVAGTLAAMMLLAATLCAAVAVWTGLFVVLGPMTVFMVGMAILPVVANRRVRSQLGRRILATRRLEDEFRWSMLLEIARDDLGLQGRLHA